MRIQSESIPHDSQRYESPGDWQLLKPPYAKEGDFAASIKVSDLGDWRMNFIMHFHEEIEAAICFRLGISQESVDEFDWQFENERRNGGHAKEDEPGDDTAAPYYGPHQFASAMERLMALELGVDWNEYGRRVTALQQTPRPQPQAAAQPDTAAGNHGGQEGNPRGTEAIEGSQDRPGSA